MLANLNASSPAPALSSIASKRLEAVRKRPSMYIGQLGPEGLHYCINDIVSDLLQKAVSGNCIAFVINDDFSLTIRSNAASLSTDLDPAQGIAAATIAFTEGPGSSNNVQNDFPRAWVLNALCQKLQLRILENGLVWGQDFINGGAQVNTFHCMGPQLGAGCDIRFWPDINFFKGDGLPCPFDITRVQALFQELAYLHPGVRFSTQDDRATASPARKIVHFLENTFAGILDSYAARFGTPATDPILLEQTVKTPAGPVHVRIAFRLFNSRHHAMLTFVNNQNTPGDHFSGTGGTHEDGFKTSVFSVLSTWQKANKNPVDFFPIDVLEGVAAAVHVQLKHPVFEGATKTTLRNPEANNAVQAVIRHFFRKQLRENSKTSQIWFENVRRAVEIRNVAQTYDF